MLARVDMAAQATEDEFLAGFDSLVQAIRRARGVGAQAGRSLTLSQFALIQPLGTHQQRRVNELAADAGITASTATRILDALQRRGIVRRRRSSSDGRVVTVTLTPEGRELLRAREAWMRGCQRAFYAGLPREERELAPDLLRRLSVLIDELAAGPVAESIR
jgi:MarR family transcriptional regulator, organic hydroperoxide resistance regulator